MPSSRLSERGGPASAPPPRGTPPGTAARNGANALRAEKRGDASPQRPRPSPSGRGPTASASLRIRRFTAAGRCRRMDGVGPAHAARRVRWGHDFRGCGELLAGMASASIRWPRRCGGTRNRAPPDKPVGHAAHGCGGPCVETLRKRAFLGMALSAEAQPSVSDVRGVMMRVPRGCEGTRSRPSCGIISERVLAGAEEPPEKTTSPMTHGRVPRGYGGTCLAASQPFDQRVLAGTEDPRPRRTGGRADGACPSRCG